MLQTLIGGPNSKLASPWGLALAPPTGFGPFSGDLLVGNFSFVASEINAFDPLTGAFEGTIPINVGPGNTPGGLWALAFGNAGNNGTPTTLFFTDGINGETDGLFGAITFVPEPSSLALLGGAFGLLGIRRASGPAGLRRRRNALTRRTQRDARRHAKATEPLCVLRVSSAASCVKTFIETLVLRTHSGDAARPPAAPGESRDRMAEVGTGFRRCIGSR